MPRRPIGLRTTRRRSSRAGATREQEFALPVRRGDSEMGPVQTAQAFLPRNLSFTHFLHLLHPRKLFLGTQKTYAKKYYYSILINIAYKFSQHLKHTKYYQI
jgi:hypothetical protein